jgi:hypothetical protein
VAFVNPVNSNKYLHSDGAPHYAIADRFFQGQFGGWHAEQLVPRSTTRRLATRSTTTSSLRPASRRPVVLSSVYGARQVPQN